MSNFKNTVSCINRFIGHSLNEPDIEGVEKNFWTCRMGEKDGEVAAIVNYRDEEHLFSATEIMAMFLGKLKTITQNETKNAVSDCVISVPVYFTDAERRAMLDAAQIAGLNCLRLINDTTATALCYGLSKNDQFSEVPKTVCFVDIGYSSMKVTIAAFTKGHLEIKGTAFDQHLGGRQFDEILVDYFAKNIQEKYKEDVKSSVRSILRLRITSEKVKKVLSGISSTKADLETESRDFPLEMTREHFEQLVSDLLVRAEKCILKALQNAGIDAQQVETVEIIGGSTRIPAVKQIISRIFNREISTTLNPDEAVARGCAFQCAIESPSFRVREFGVKDIVSYPIKVTWNSPEGVKDVEVFPSQSHLPCVKPLFTTQPLPVEICAYYSQLTDLPAGTESKLAKFVVSGAKGLSTLESKVRIDIGISGHGLVEVKKALLIDEKIEEVPATEPDTPKQTKKVVREYELSFTSETSSRDQKQLQKLKDAEFALALNDKYAQELDDSKNSLEEYIYDMRSKLEDTYRQFARTEESSNLLSQLTQAEDWLYSDHENESKEIYANKLKDLKKLGDPIAKRAYESEHRPQAEALLRQLVSVILEKCKDPKYEEESLVPIVSECQATFNWIDAQSSNQAAVPLHENPALTVAAINEKREKLLTTTNSLFMKAKLKKTEEPVMKAEESPASSPETSTDSAAPNMDID